MTNVIDKLGSVNYSLFGSRHPSERGASPSISPLSPGNKVSSPSHPLPSCLAENPKDFSPSSVEMVMPRFYDHHIYK